MWMQASWEKRLYFQDSRDWSVVWVHVFVWKDVLHNNHNGNVPGSHHTQSTTTTTTTIKLIITQDKSRAKSGADPLYLAYFWKLISLGMDRGRITRTAVTTMVNFLSVYQ